MTPTSPDYILPFHAFSTSGTRIQEIRRGEGCITLQDLFELPGKP